MLKVLTKQKKRLQRHRKIRARITGTIDRPRLSIFCSNQHIYAQIIDDTSGQTLVAASTLEFRSKFLKQSAAGRQGPLKSSAGRGLDKAKQVGELIARRALDKNIKAVVFDRGGFAYAGRVKALAEAARTQGLQF